MANIKGHCNSLLDLSILLSLQNNTLNLKENSSNYEITIKSKYIKEIVIVRDYICSSIFIFDLMANLESYGNSLLELPKLVS